MEPSFKADLNKYINDCKLRLQKILQALEWTEDDTLKDYNTNSIASCSKHALKKSGPASKSTFPRSCLTENSLLLETPKLQVLLNSNELKAPENFEELQSNFSREQKLKIYEHVIENTEKLDNNLLEKEVEGELSLADILAQKKREDKRKKRRFRKSKPTHIEEVRCLVDLQMQAFEQFMGIKTKTREEISWESNSAEQQVRLKEEIHIGETSNFEDNYYKKDRYTTYRERKDHARSRSKETFRHKHKRHKRSLSVEGKEFRRERRRSLISSEDDRQHKKDHRSKRKHKSKERKESRRSRSHNKKVSKEKKRHRSEKRSRSHDGKPSKDRNNGQITSYNTEQNNKCLEIYSRKEFFRDNSYERGECKHHNYSNRRIGRREEGGHQHYSSRKNPKYYNKETRHAENDRKRTDKDRLLHDKSKKAYKS